MGVMADGERHGGAQAVQVDAAWFAVVREAGAVVAARVTVEGALFVGGDGEEGEAVLGVRRVADALRHLGAGDVEGVVAGLARVSPAGGTKGTAGARRRGERLLQRCELQRVGVAEMVDPWFIAQSSHASSWLSLKQARVLLASN